MFVKIAIFLAIFKSASSGRSDTVERNSLFHNNVEIRKLASMNIVDFIRYHGYPVEAHEVFTEDSYVLTMHRVPHGKNENATRRGEDCVKPVVYLQHGLFAFSGDWFLTGPEKALGFILADAGYDVWTGNARGNKESRDHLVLDPNVDAEFWNFSFHEIGYYDLPAMIDHILAQTKQERLFYVGHSQGTTANYVMLSERPEYNDKIIAQFSLAPVAYMSNVYGRSGRMFAHFQKLFKFGADLLNIHELGYNNRLFRHFIQKFCSTPFVNDLCEREIFAFVGHNPAKFNQTLLPIMTANYPAGSSVKQIMHFAQEIRTGNFEQFDHGTSRNLIMYNDHYPPAYNLQNIKSPIYITCSGNDYLSSLKDVKRFYWALPEGKKHIWKVEDDKWNHIDYIFGIDAKTMVYDKVMTIMKKYVQRDDFCQVE